MVTWEEVKDLLIDLGHKNVADILGIWIATVPEIGEKAAELLSVFNMISYVFPPRRIDVAMVQVFLMLRVGRVDARSMVELLELLVERLDKNNTPYLPDAWWTLEYFKRCLNA